MVTPDGDRFGNEWLVAGRQYLRIAVTEDGLYRIDAAALASAGMAMGGGNEGRYQLHHFGREEPLEITDAGINFYGRRARGEFDAYLFENPLAEQLNPRYGMYTDTAVYYLSVAEAGSQVQRFTENSVSGSATPSPVIYRAAERVFGDHQSKYYRRSAGSSIVFSHYELAEGYGSRRSSDLLSSNGSTTSLASLDLPESAGGTASLQLRFSVAFGDRHDQLLEVSGNRVAEITSTGWGVQDLSYQVPTAAGQSIDVELTGRAGDQDKANLAYVSIQYPARPVFGGGQLAFTLPAGPATSVTFTNLPAGARLYDLERSTVATPTDGAFTVAAATSARRLLLLSDYVSPVVTPVVTGGDLLPPAATDYLFLASRRLAGAGLDALVEHRRSAVGGNHRTHVVFVEDIYDNFGYGYARHPQAIRNYLDAAIAAAGDLNYLFLIGKGREYPAVRTPEAFAEAGETALIPSFGLPSSDNLLSAPRGKFTPRLATGRLAAINPAEVLLYANKLREVELQVTIAGQSIDDLDWMKQALFLGGGQTAGEQATIRRNLERIQQVFESSKFGGEVTGVFRTSTDPIETTRQEAIFDRINAGTAFITFYGHSSSQGFDFNIDNPENYENKAKYPFMISLGCYSGDAFTEARSISERFIFLPDGGAVTFAASKGLGYLSALGAFGRTLYDQMGNDQYGEGVGDGLRAAIAEYEGTGNFTLGILMEQFALSGDPAFRLHPRPGPDLVIDPATVRFEPGVVPAQDSSYRMTLRVLNLGILPGAAEDSTRLRFRQQLPSGEIRELLTHTLAVPGYAADVEVELPNLGLDAVGLNRILVTVDALEEVAELPAAAEQNNELVTGGEAGVPLTVIANSARTVFPPRYATVGTGLEALVASTTDPLAPERNYRIQVSPRADFTTLLVDDRFTSRGGVLRYRPSIAYTDSTTYYWRISPDSSSTEDSGLIWDASSFTYLADRAVDRVGYALADPGQLAEGTNTHLRVPTDRPYWGFDRVGNDVQFFNSVYRDRRLPQLVWNGTGFSSPHNWAVRAGVQVLVIDSIDNFDWLDAGDGSYNSVPSPRVVDPWSFDTRTDEGRQGLISFLDEGVAPGKYVVLYSAQRGDDIEYHGPRWQEDSLTYGRTLYQALEAEGAEQVRLLQGLGSVPYTFIYQKGLGKLAEAVATDQQAQTEVLVSLEENLREGAYRSERFGPALEWRNLNLRFLPGQIGPADSCHFYLYGSDGSGRRTLLQDGPLSLTDRLTYDYDLSAYAAADHPYLSVDLELFDEAQRTAASVREVYVDYLRPGDVAVSPTIAYSLPDTLSQGEEAVFTIGYENVARTAMDSLLVELSITDQDNRVTRQERRKGPLAGGASDQITFDLPTVDEGEALRLLLTLNPDGDQPEVIRFNNIALTQVGVATDRIAPDMKVYYDGRRIRDNELVSGEPEILIQLRDENPFRRLVDSSAYRIELRSPDGSTEDIRMDDQRVQFVPAPADGENRAEVYFRPTLLQDGTYTLTVESGDRSGNAAGRLAYSQSFEVINQTAISNVLTYPNPFTTSTRFVYTLTGSVAPEVFRVQIMTVSGRVVRDIDLLANESISVGTHRTDYAWDGTDEYGDPLANGVYLYRVITSDGSGETMESYDTGTDQYFRNGLGKVVILR